MLLFLVLLLLNQFASSLTQEVSYSQADILFDTADIALTYPLADGDYVSIQAFKTKRTNQLLAKPPSELTSNDIHTLRWVTPGICHFIPDSFKVGRSSSEAKLSCVDSRLQSFVAEKASLQYGLDISPDQILRLTLSKLICKMTAYLEGKKVTLHGEVTSFQRHPLTVVFETPYGSDKREIILSSLLSNETLTFDCDTYANGKVERKNSFSVDFNSQMESEFLEQLLGDGDVKFVTRNQLDSFSENLYESLNVEEEYEIPLETFSDSFVLEFVRLGGTYGFKQEPIANALQLLSQYATDTTQDLKPDTIIKELGSLYSIAENNNEKHVVVNHERLAQLQQKYSTSNSDSKTGKAGINANFIKLFSAGTSGEINTSASQTKLDESHGNNQSKSLMDELNKLNSKIANQVTFEIVGTRVLPKSLSVAKFIRSKLRKTLQLRRVRKQQYLAPYHERIQIRYNDKTSEQFTSDVIVVLRHEIDKTANMTKALVAKTKSDVYKHLTETSSNLSRQIHENSNNTKSLRFAVDLASETASEALQMGKSVDQFLRNTALLRRCRFCCTFRCAGRKHREDESEEVCGDWIDGNGTSVAGTGYYNRVWFKLECQSTHYT